MWETIKEVAGDWTGNILQIADNLVPDVPPEVLAACGQMNAFLAQHGWISEVFPIWALVIASAMVVAAIVAAAMIRAARIAVSVRSGGGGA